MYYPCSENKGADQLRGYREADLRLCFRLCRLLVFPCDGSNIDHSTFYGMCEMKYYVLSNAFRVQESYEIHSIRETLEMCPYDTNILQSFGGRLI